MRGAPRGRNECMKKLKTAKSCRLYIFELTVSAYIITKSPGVKIRILINANIAATTTWWST